MLAVVAVVQWALVVNRPPGDFGNHVELARRLLAGRPLYEGGLDVPYAPFWALVHVPFALLPLRVAQTLATLLGLGAAAALFRLLRRLAPGPALSPERQLVVDAAALVLASRFLLRDLADGGPNTGLVALAWLALYLLSRGRDGAAGAVLGLATALKWTPGLFLALLLWKRRWRAAAAGFAFTALFSVSPGLVMGREALVTQLATWAGTVGGGVLSGDPSIGVLGPESAGNIALRPVLGRLVPLPPRAATAVTWAVLAALVAAVAWRCREPFRPGGEAPVDDWAAIGLLAVLLSPVSWRAHAVAALPALYLLAEDAVRARRIRTATIALLVPWVLLLLVLNRSLAGKAFTDLLHSWGAFTALLVGLLAVTLSLRGTTRVSPGP